MSDIEQKLDEILVGSVVPDYYDEAKGYLIDLIQSEKRKAVEKVLDRLDVARAKNSITGAILNIDIEDFIDQERKKLEKNDGNV